MEPIIKQRLLFNLLSFAKEKLAQEEFNSIDVGSMAYTVHGDTCMLTYCGKGFVIQSYVYGDGTDHVMILAHGVCYSSR